MTVVVDASVAVKWVVDEAGSDLARQLAVDEALAAPDLLFAECANVMRTLTRHGALTPVLAREALAAIDATPIRMIAGRPHVAAALAIALEIDRSAYDSLYLAVALAERATLVTADARFARAVMAHPVYGGAIRLLA